MAMLDLGNLVAHISLDGGLFGKGVLSVEQHLNRLGNKVALFGAKMSAAVTLPLTLIGRNAINAFSEFDNAIVKAMAVMEVAGEKSRAALEGTVTAISKQSNIPVIELAKGYYFLAQAGLDVERAMIALPVVERLAVAGTMNLSNTVEVLVQSQNALGLATGDANEYMKQMTRVSDNLTQAAISTTSEVEDFAYALTNKGAAGLRLVNKSIEEGVAVLMSFAMQGIKSEEAGEKMYMMLRDVQRASIKFQDVWRQNGITVYDTSGQMLNVADIIEQLEVKMSGMSDEWKRYTLMMLGFQDRSLAATQMLMGTSDKIRQFQKDLTSAGNVTRDIAEKYMKSFAGQMAILKNYIQAARIELGRLLAGELLPLTEYLKKLTEIWKGLSEPVKEFIVHVGLIAIAIGPVALAIGGLLKMLASFTSVIGFILSPIGILLTVFGSIALASKVTSTAIDKNFSGAARSIKTLLDKIKNWTKEDSENLTYYFKNVAIELDALKDKFRAFIDYIKNDWTNAGATAFDIFIAAVQFMGTAVIDIALRTGKGIWKALTLGLGNSYDEALKIYDKKYKGTYTSKYDEFDRAAGEWKENKPMDYPGAYKTIPGTWLLKERKEPAFTEEFSKIQRELETKRMEEITNSVYDGLPKDLSIFAERFKTRVDAAVTKAQHASTVMPFAIIDKDINRLIEKTTSEIVQEESKIISDSIGNIMASYTSDNLTLQKTNGPLTAHDVFQKELKRIEDQKVELQARIQLQKQATDLWGVIERFGQEQVKNISGTIDEFSALAKIQQIEADRTRRGAKGQSPIPTMDVEEAEAAMQKMFSGINQASEFYHKSESRRLTKEVEQWKNNAEFITTMTIKDYGMEEAAIKKLIEAYDAYQRRLLKRQEALAGNNFFKGMNAGIDQLDENLGTIGKLGYDVGQSLTEGIGSAFANLITQSQDFAESMRNLGLEIANMLIKWAAMKLITTAFSGFGGMFSSAINSNTGGVQGGNYNVPAQHTGGIMGVDAFPTRSIPASVFANAIRAHTGIGPNERPAVIRKDEGVFTPGQMKAMGGRTAQTDMLLSEILGALRQRQTINAMVVDQREVITRKQLESPVGEKMVMRHVRRNS